MAQPLLGLANHVFAQQGKERIWVANMYHADFVAEVVPGLVLVASTFLAALPALRTVRQSTRGRARSATAWILGFFVGVIVTMLLSVTIGDVANSDAPVAGCGLVGAFFGPFIGIVRGKWLGPMKRKRRAPELSHGISN
jgi:glycerol uptake facilitator-like aquaporin